MKLSTLIPAVLFGTTCAQAAVFPVPDTPYKVRWTSSELVDQNRADPFNASHPRRIMISRFTPIRKRDCVKSCRVPYMNDFMASLEEAIMDGFFGEGVWPGGLLASLEMEVCCKTRSGPHDEFPMLLLDTGRNTTRLLYSGTAQQFASIGYEVIVMDHPYETDAVEFPDGTVIYGGRVPRDPNATEALQFGLDARSADASFVLDRLGIRKPCKVGFVGDSFGGPAAANALLHDSRIGAGVNIDGLMVGRAVDLGVARPFLIFGSTGHNSSSDDTWARFLDAMATQQPGTWIKELSVADSLHGYLTDFPLIGDVAGLRDNQQIVDMVIGKITGARMMEILTAYLPDFFAMALEGKPEGLLAGPSKLYPEVAFL
ncbi:Platelet-activating factor acetylhydrolase [Madurella mycetomatis]|uniref:1-alkyl-2-acetylglycerophosphocholine esterase n=1 Tax=Madurella mycetomatis TaxID=100816 RepID=A0A175VPP7_9PEZI|nr:Platelet-activating factor acetylhydrolase [Madurella mycetomatis]